MDAAGNLAIGFSVSGLATFPSVRYAARLATDPPGTLAQGEADLVAGGGSQTHSSGRWGDYSMLVVDPSDDCTFWYTQEYYASTSSIGWRTRIGTFTFALMRSAVFGSAGADRQGNGCDGRRSGTGERRIHRDAHWRHIDAADAFLHQRSSSAAGVLRRSPGVPPISEPHR